MNREWIEILSSASALLIASVLLFGTAMGRRYRGSLRGGTVEPRKAIAIGLAAGLGALAITAVAHYARFGSSLEPLRVGSTLILPAGVALITYFVFRK